MISLTLQPYDWIVEDRFTETGHLEVHAWCLDRESNPVLARINNFPAFCYIELPEIVNGRHFNWTSYSIDKFMTWLKFALKEDAPQKSFFEMKKSLYYYRQGKKFPMLLVSFPSIEAMNHCSNFLAKAKDVRGIGIVLCKVWEARIPVVRKLLTQRGSKFAQWFRVDGNLVTGEAKISTLDQEYYIEWRSLNPVPFDESFTWQTHPKILSWDIETYSTNHRAMPDKNHVRHVVYLISCVTQRNGKPETREKRCFVFGDCAPTNAGIVIKLGTERELIQAFIQFIRDYDPEILIGYNILKYDYPYLDTRLQRKLDSWGCVGRLIGRESKMNTMDWKSDAYGYQEINCLQMEGRINIDLLPIMKRDFKTTLSKFDLNTVSNYFLKRGKHPVKAHQMFEAYEAYLNDKTSPEALEGMRKIVDYCFEDSDLVIDLFSFHNIWIGLIELANVVGVTMTELSTRGQQIRCLSQIYDLASRMGFVVTRELTDDDSFAGGFVYPPIPGLYQNIPCLDFASLYPSIISQLNICYTTLVPPDYQDRVPDEQCHVRRWTETVEIGDEAAVDADFDETEIDPLAEAEVEAPASTREVEYHYKWVTAETQKGVMPLLVEALVRERNAVRKKQKGLKSGSLEWAILQARQLALKVSANSMFGFYGVRNGLLPLFAAARCICHRGRELIGLVNKYLEDKYQARVVYNDTDSSMVDMAIKDRKECNRIGNTLAEEISGSPEIIKPDGTIIPARPGLFPPPLRMEFEKGMILLCIKKKKYAAAHIKDDGRVPLEEKYEDFIAGKCELTDKEILVRGIVPAQRKNCKWLVKTYLRVLATILCHRPAIQTLTLIVEAVEDLLEDRVPISHLAGISELGANYKNESYFLNLFSNYLKRIGTPAAPGDRLEYVIVEDETQRLVGNRMRLLESYLEDENRLPIDKFYYLENILRKPIEQIWQIAYKEDLIARNEIGVKSGRKNLYLDNPVLMMTEFHRSGVPVRKILELWDL